MTAPTLTAISVTVGSSTISGTIGGTSSGGKYPVSIEVPYGTNVTALVTTATYSSEPTGVTVGGSAFVSGTTAVNYSTAKDMVITNGDGSTTYTITVTVDEQSVMTVQDIFMAGWTKVKVIKLDHYDYSSGGFATPYKARAVLAVNSDTVTGGYIYDNSGTQKLKLLSGANEASGELTADIYLLLE